MLALVVPILGVAAVRGWAQPAAVPIGAPPVLAPSVSPPPASVWTLTGFRWVYNWSLMVYK